MSWQDTIDKLKVLCNNLTLAGEAFGLIKMEDLS